MASEKQSPFTPFKISRSNSSYWKNKKKNKKNILYDPDDIVEGILG